MIYSKKTLRIFHAKISEIHSGVSKLWDNKHAMLRPLGGGQIKKNIENGGSKSQNCKNNNK